jgi:FkbM family methyltransferase
MKTRFLWRSFKTRFRDQVAELKAIRSHVRENDFVCDIGAHKGSYLYWLSKWVPAGGVIAFEPQPILAQYLTDAVRTLSMNNVVVEQKAVFASSGRQMLIVPGDGAVSPGASLARPNLIVQPKRTIEVESVSLDDYFSTSPKPITIQDHRGVERRISLLKVDVEGSELEVFQGAERLLQKHRPLLIFECERRHLSDRNMDDTFAFILGFGYRGSFVHGRRLIPLAEFKPNVHQRQEGERYWDSTDYCNNFVFWPD